MLLLKNNSLKALAATKISLGRLIRQELDQWPVHKAVCFLFSMLWRNGLRSLAVCPLVCGLKSFRTFMTRVLDVWFVEIKITAVDIGQKSVGRSSWKSGSTVALLCLVENVKKCAAEWKTRASMVLRSEADICVRVWEQCTDSNVLNDT